MDQRVVVCSTDQVAAQLTDLQFTLSANKTRGLSTSPETSAQKANRPVA